MTRWIVLVFAGLLVTACSGAPFEKRPSQGRALTQLNAQPPAAPATEIAGLVGQYGSPEDMLIIFEDVGGLFAANGAAKPQRLQRLDRVTYGGGDGGRDKRFTFERGPGGDAVAVTIGGVRYLRRDFGAETEAVIRAGVKADAGRLRAAALAASPPVEPVKPKRLDLAPLSTIDPGIRFDIRYATANNFMGLPLYDRPGAYLQRDAAKALGRAQARLAARGYGLLIHDAYRPWFVTKMFWDATPASARVFVADPAQGSRHNRGGAVDLTLYDLNTGAVVEMPGRYDEFSSRSHADYVGGTSRQRWHRDLLRQAMEAEGFGVYPEEWWHFDYKDWRDYPIGNLTFEQVEKARR